MRIHLQPGTDPFVTPPAAGGANAMVRGQWPACWVEPDRRLQPEEEVVLFRRRFAWPGGRLRLHLTADQRYTAFLDGQPLGGGPERGDVGHWHFDSYEADLAAGEHVLVVRVWSLATPPRAQIGLRRGLLCAAELADRTVLHTGVAAWEWRLDRAWAPLPSGECWGVGSRVRVTVDQDFLDGPVGGGADWRPVQSQAPALVWRGGHALGPRTNRQLQPAVLPAQRADEMRGGAVRHVSCADPAEPVRAADHRADEAAAWQALLTQGRELALPPRTRRLVLIDLGVYRCAFPLISARGTGRLRVEWAEALFAEATGGRKDDRAACLDHWFRGVGDEFDFTGPAGTASTLWWESGRFVRVEATSGEQPLALTAIAWREVGYPLTVEAAFTSSDAGFDACAPVMIRTLERCAHETFMDCPYYEQLQYVGDTRLECLALRALTRDHRLADKALATFAWSLSADGRLDSCYPNVDNQNIPPFTLLWIGMLHDTWLYGDLDLVRRHLGAMRAIREAFRSRVDAAGRVAFAPGWNFFDWVSAPGWDFGEPPGVVAADSSLLAWLLAWTFGQCAELEAWAGEPALAERDRALAQRIAGGCETFWDEARGLYRDSAGSSGGARFSEHAQILALLSGLVPAARAERLLDGLAGAADLARTTVYFSHYLFEVAGRFRRPELLSRRLGYWRDLPGQGFTTVPEAPEPSRSDCHAWGSHPLYHRAATVLGIRPAAPGFAAVRIAPQLGRLTAASGTWPHRLGDISVNVDGAHGRVELPPGLPGTLILDDREIAIDGSCAW